MLNWQEVPFVRLLIPFITGLLCAAKGIFNEFSVLHFTVFWATGYMVLLVWAFRSMAFGRRWISGTLIFALCYLLGLLLWRIQSPAVQPHHYLQQQDQEQYYLFRINAIKPSSSGKTNRLEIAIMGFGKQPERMGKVSGRSFCYLPADFPFSVGEFYLAKGKFQALQSPIFPVSFDFANFMQQQGMVRQLYIPDKTVYACKSAPVANWQTRLIRTSARLQARLQSLLPASSAGLVSALVLGKKDQLDPETKTDYAKVGAMHVLAVSGMHVGIVAMGLQFLLAFWRKPGRMPKMIKAGISLIAIWCFALLAGAGPSVLRAATMFSLFTIGKELYLQKNVWNIIAATAFLMLSFDTRALFSVGFQLSYAAVASIIYFQPRLYKLLIIPQKGLDYFWQLLSLGIAAQVGTAAISIHYFHQFPLYFWLSGLVVVPLATLALLLGVGVLVVGRIPVIGMVLSFILHHLISFMNRSMAWIAQLPASQVDHLFLSNTATILILGLMLGAIFYYHFREKKWVYGLFLLATMLVFQRYSESTETLEQRALLIYESKPGLSMSLVEGAKAITFSKDSATLQSIAYAKNNFLTEKRIRNQDHQFFQSGTSLLEWQGIRVLFVSESTDFCRPDPPIDLLVLGLPFRENNLLLLQELGPKKILLSNALNYRDHQKWELALQEAGLLIANSDHSNAYYLPLK